MIGMGIAWASMTGVPSLMVVTIVPSRRIGVYLGILNMMVVVPMLIQTVTFGWIFEHLLGGNATTAIIAGRDPARVRRYHDAVGQPAAAGRGVAARPARRPAALPDGLRRGDRRLRRHAHVVRGRRSRGRGRARGGGAVGRGDRVRPEREAQRNHGRGPRQLLYGRERAEAAMEASVRELTSGKRVRQFEQRIVAAPPARALLERAGENPKEPHRRRQPRSRRRGRPDPRVGAGRGGGARDVQRPRRPDHPARGDLAAMTAVMTSPARRRRRQGASGGDHGVAHPGWSGQPSGAARSAPRRPERIVSTAPALTTTHPAIARGSGGAFSMIQAKSTPHIA